MKWPMSNNNISNLIINIIIISSMNLKTDREDPSISRISMDQSQIRYVDGDALKHCVSFIKTYNSGKMIEQLYAPNKKNKQKQTLNDQIFLSVQSKIRKIALSDLKRKQQKFFSSGKD